jgi:hypothetical protein
MSVSQRYILEQISASPAAQVKEKSFTVLIGERLGRAASLPPEPQATDFAETRERLSQLLAEGTGSGFAVPTSWYPAPRIDFQRHYIWRGLAAVTFSVAMSLTVYALTDDVRSEASASENYFHADLTPVIASLTTSDKVLDDKEDIVPETKPVSLANVPPGKPEAGSVLENHLNTTPEVVIAAPTVSGVSKVTEEAFLQRAAHQLQLDDISGARRIYQTLALQGSNQGAFGLAKTYDADFLSRHNVVGMKPDMGLARQWYEKAALLGNTQAAERLKMLK